MDEKQKDNIDNLDGKQGEIAEIKNEVASEETDDEKIDRVAKQILEKYRHAFEVLAKN